MPTRPADDSLPAAVSKPHALPQAAPAVPKSPASGQIRSVQVLRAIAALFVVAFHSTILWRDKFDAALMPWENGNSGVDLFFVISGFIMVVSSCRLRDRPNGWRQFIMLRLVRIVPMYWFATAAKLGAILAGPSLVLHTRPTAWNIIASFLFVPSHDAAGMVRPVLNVGWTLSYEMLFYLVFATALFFMLDPVIVVGATMAVLAVASVVRQADWPAITTLADPLVLEFVLGVVIGRAYLSRSRQQVAFPWALPISAAGLLCLAFVPADGRWQRVTHWGLAATAMLYGSVLVERRISRYLPNLIVRIGEASYSLYLTHGFVLPVVGIAAARLKLTGTILGFTLVVCSLLLSTVVSLAIYRWVEVPMTAWLRSFVNDRHQASALAPQTPI